MKRAGSYFIFMIFAFVAIVIIDTAILVGIHVNTHGDAYIVALEKISNEIIEEENTYQVNETVYNMLDEKNAFAFIIDEDGKVDWEYKKPEEIKDEFTISDVASFTKWYLNDYPVYSWIREESILVVGFPKDTIWKYGFEVNLSTVNAIVTVAPYIIISNVLVIIFLPLLITRKWNKKREQARSEWIAGVSHDIRTPLSIILGNAESGSVTEKQCLRVKELIGNLNTDNKLEAGTGKWNDSDIKITVLLREIVCDYINSYEDKWEFDFDVSSNLEKATITADENLIRRMIENIISNSIRHNEEGCKIRIAECMDSHGKLNIVVSDNGKGVDKDTLKKLNARLKKDYLPEHGLGIRVIKQIAKHYHYKLQFQSELGKYFETSIIIPKVK